MISFQMRYDNHSALFSKNVEHVSEGERCPREACLLNADAHQFSCIVDATKETFQRQEKLEEDPAWLTVMDITPWKGARTMIDNSTTLLEGQASSWSTHFHCVGMRSDKSDTNAVLKIKIFRLPFVKLQTEMPKVYSNLREMRFQAVSLGLLQIGLHGWQIYTSITKITKTDSNKKSSMKNAISSFTHCIKEIS